MNRFADGLVRVDMNIQEDIATCFRVDHDMIQDILPDFCAFGLNDGNYRISESSWMWKIAEIPPGFLVRIWQ